MNMAVKMVTAPSAGCCEKRAGMNAHCSMKLVAAGELDQEEQHVEADQDEGDDGSRPPLTVVITDGEHLASCLVRELS
jgi:hypothetical protein